MSLLLGWTEKASGGFHETVYISTFIGLYFIIWEIKSVLSTRLPVLFYFYLKVSAIFKIC
jgi:hypothetical protein